MPHNMLRSNDSKLCGRNLCSTGNKLSGTLLLMFLSACANHSTKPAAAHSSTSIETIEVLGPNSFRHDGNVRTAEGLGQALLRDDDAAGVIKEPLRIVADESTPLEVIVPALEAATRGGSDRVNLTLEILDDPVRRSSSLPLRVDHGCDALMLYDGTYEYDDHGESPRYVYVQVIFESGGALVIEDCGYQGEESFAPILELADAPEGIADGAPQSGTPLNFDELHEWFDALEAQGVRAFVCLDWQPTTTMGRFVDALRAMKSAVGPRVLLGPDIWGGPEPEESDLEFVEGE